MSSTTSMIADTLPTSPESLLPLALKAMQRTPNPRLLELVSGLTRHLHQFVCETRLSETEFEQALEWINAIGQATNDRNNEAVLVADLLGVSSLVTLLANAGSTGTSDAALLGPFWREQAPRLSAGSSIAAPGTPGVTLEARGTVRDARGKPVGGATVDVWQASPKGLYENQDPAQPDMNLRGRFETDDQGRFFFRSVRPAGYPVPTGGPGGALLQAQLRDSYRPAHLHLMISKPGFRVLVTQVFPHDDERLGTDPVFGVTQRLVGQFEDGLTDGQPVVRLEHDFTLIEGELVFPRPPIP